MSEEYVVPAALQDLFQPIKKATGASSIISCIFSKL